MKRVVRSTNVPIAALPRPMRRSPSQCPGPARSLGLGGPLADHDVGADQLLAATTAASPRRAQRPPGAQAGRQLAAQCPPPLDGQRLVNRLVRDPHRVIVGIRDPEPMGDLLRAPRCRPMSVLAAAMTSTTPGAHVWTRHGRPVLSHHGACEAVLHVAPQPIVRGQLGDLRARGTSGAVPLRSRRPIRQTAAPSRRVATSLSRDRRRGSPEPTGNVTHPGALSAQDRDLFPLRKGQGASRSGRQADRRPTTALTEPPTTHGRRHATGHSGILTRQPPRDRLPEPLLLRTPRCRRPTRRTHRRPTRPV